MDKKQTYALRKKVADIIAAIDLNYILAEAKRDQYKISLMCGDLDANITWSGDISYLSYNYEMASGIIYHFISVHKDKIIKINISSDNDIFPLNKNIIIYVPYEIDLNRVKKEYTSIVDLN
jgi:hypothetical protein